MLLISWLRFSTVAFCAWDPNVPVTSNFRLTLRLAPRARFELATLRFNSRWSLELKRPIWCRVQGIGSHFFFSSCTHAYRASVLVANRPGPPNRRPPPCQFQARRRTITQDSAANCTERRDLGANSAALWCRVLQAQATACTCAGI